MSQLRTAADILLAEGNQNDLDVALAALEKHGFANDVCVARTGMEALDFIFCQGLFSHRSLTDQPRVVLLDFELPLIHGTEVLRRIRADSRTHAIPVVAFTSTSSEADLVYELGGNSCIAKPTDRSQFSEAIRLIAAYWLTVNRPLLGGTHFPAARTDKSKSYESRYR